MQAFRMSGMGASFRPARACPVMNGPHIGPDDSTGGIMVVDAATRDRSASVRVVMWRCQFCGTQLTGIGHADAPVGEIGVQEFTWLEEEVALLAPVAARAVAKEAV